MPRREEPTPNLNVEFREGLPQFSKSSTEKIAKCTSSDLELVAFKERVYIGWLQKKEQVPEGTIGCTEII